MGMMGLIQETINLLMSDCFPFIAIIDNWKWMLALILIGTGGSLALDWWFHRDKKNVKKNT